MKENKHLWIKDRKLVFEFESTKNGKSDANFYNFLLYHSLHTDEELNL